MTGARLRSPTMPTLCGTPPTAPARIGIAGAALLSLSVVPAFGQVDAGFEPVPAASLSEQTLTVPEENFSVQAPGPQWEWLRDIPTKNAVGRSYLCRNLRTGERLLLSVSKPSVKSTESAAQGLLTGVRESQEAKGRQVVGERSEPSDIPAPGSRRVSAMITAPGMTMYFTAYALVADRLYVFQNYSEASKESAAFNALARSFAFKSPTPPRRRNWFGDRSFVLALYASILVAGIGLGSLFNAISRRPVLDGGLIAFVLIMLVMMIRIAGELSGGISAEKVGSVVAEALVPAMVAAWAHDRFTKSRRVAARR